MKESETIKSQERQVYVPAEVTVIGISERSVICQSGGMRQEDYGNGGFSQENG